MTTKKFQLDNYRKFLLNRVTSTPHIIEYIENCLSSEDPAVPHTFHKIMIHNWSGNDVELFNTLGEYFSPNFVPVNYTSQGKITTFYTSSLILILKMAKHDFLFPHQKTLSLSNMYNLDILFNDKSSADCFENSVTIENVVAGVVSCRLNDKFELDLSNFCNDPEFIQKKIHFYKINLLSQYKILMLRMGKDTKVLNLSNNNLSQAPVDILNFFIKGDLIAINLSNNNIPSLYELQRISSKIEKLWIEGNPLCDEIDPVTYVKSVLVKFPRLTELDGIRLNENGIRIPYFKNYLDTPDKKTKMLVEKFLSLYFAHYDSNPRKSIDMFYDINAKLSISTNFPGGEHLDHYNDHSRNILNANTKKIFNNRLCVRRSNIVALLSRFPESVHDPSTFTVDVLKHDKRTLVLVVDGIFKEKHCDKNDDRFFQFRRTFIFSINLRNNINEYFITNEMFTLSLASKELAESSFKDCARPTNPLALKTPDKDDSEALCNIFSHLTQLKRPEAELRLKIHGWNITSALNEFMQDMKQNKISPDRFAEEDDFSDSSSLVDEID